MSREPGDSDETAGHAAAARGRLGFFQWVESRRLEEPDLRRINVLSKLYILTADQLSGQCRPTEAVREDNRLSRVFLEDD